MKSIECNSPHYHHHLLSQQRNRYNAAKISPFCCKSKRGIQQREQFYGINIVSRVNVMPLNHVEAFPTDYSLTLAVAKPADISVLIQTSALLIFVYLVANFLVPQLLSKSLGFDKVDENEMPSNSDSGDDEKPRPTSSKRGFNSPKPK